MSFLGKTQNPALPVPSREYSPGYMGQLLNVLRIFFGSITQKVNAIGGAYGATYIQAPTAQFFDTTGQSAISVDTAYPVSFGDTRFSNGFEINGANDSQITAVYSGLYQVNFHAQLVSHSAGAKTVTVWAAIDGAAVPNSAKIYTLAGSGEAMEITWSSVVELQAGSYFEIEWATDDTDVDLHAEAATSLHPGVPSAVLSIVLVSGVE